MGKLKKMTCESEPSQHSKAVESVFVDRKEQQQYGLDFSECVDPELAKKWLEQGLEQGWIKVQDKKVSLSLDSMLLSAEVFWDCLGSLHIGGKRHFTFLLFDNCQEVSDIQEELLEHLFEHPSSKELVGNVGNGEIAVAMPGVGRFAATAFAERVISSIQEICVAKKKLSPLRVAIVDYELLDNSMDFYTRAKLAMQGKCSSNSTDSVFIYMGSLPAKENKALVQVDEKRFLFFGI